MPRTGCSVVVDNVHVSFTPGIYFEKVKMHIVYKDINIRNTKHAFYALIIKETISGLKSKLVLLISGYPL